MHELGLITKIIDNARNAAIKADINSVSVVRMKIGKMAGFEPEQLNFLFTTYEKDNRLKNAKLEIEEVPVKLRCTGCQHTFIDERFNDHAYAHAISHTPYAYVPPPCPKCHAINPEMINGKELYIVDLEGE